MIAQPEELAQQARKYVGLARAYLRQAASLLDEGEGGKAAGLLWGALVAAANSLAFIYSGQPLHRHSDTSRFLRQLAQSIPEINQAREAGEQFHANFYHSFMDDIEVREKAPRVAAGVDRLIALLPAL